MGTVGAKKLLIELINVYNNLNLSRSDYLTNAYLNCYQILKLQHLIPIQTIAKLESSFSPAVLAVLNSPNSPRFLTFNDFSKSLSDAKIKLDEADPRLLEYVVSKSCTTVFSNMQYSSGLELWIKPFIKIKLDQQAEKEKGELEKLLEGPISFPIGGGYLDPIRGLDSFLTDNNTFGSKLTLPVLKLIISYSTTLLAKHQINLENSSFIESIHSFSTYPKGVDKDLRPILALILAIRQIESIRAASVTEESVVNKLDNIEDNEELYLFWHTYLKPKMDSGEKTLDKSFFDGLLSGKLRELGLYPSGYLSHREIVYAPDPYFSFDELGDYFFDSIRRIRFQKYYKEWQKRHHMIEKEV